MDYLLYNKNNIYEEITNDVNGFIDIKSLTKFIVLIGFLDCAKKYGVKLTHNISSIINYQHKSIRFIDIINHTSGLEYQKKITNSRNIYNFSLGLAHYSNIMGNYNYNQYSYNILSYTVYNLSGKHIDEYLNEFLLNDIKYEWTKYNNIPIAGYGLHIHTNSMKKLFTKIANEMEAYNFSYYYDKFRMAYKEESHLFIGHHNFYYCKSLKSFLVYFGKENFKEVLIKMLNK